MATQPIYQFYAELAYFEPRIWRRFQVSANTTMAKLAYILMTLYEMEGGHMFALTVPAAENLKAYLEAEGAETGNVAAFGGPERRFEIPHENYFDFFDTEEAEDATTFKIKDVLPHPGDQLLFEYDFGDSWEVGVVLEEIVTDKELPARELPRVLAGEGYGIIEDCGGVGGLADIAAAYEKHEGDEYEEFIEWLGKEDFDLSEFDMPKVNRRLKTAPRFFKGIYE